MTSTFPTVQVRRPLDRSHHRKPLRVQITRRRTGKPASGPQFVTQVRFGGREAVVLPWDFAAAVNGRDRSDAAPSLFPVPAH
jgi:hypothetical protein